MRSSSNQFCHGLEGYDGLTGENMRVYELVTRHFIATVSPDAIWESTCVTFNVSPLDDKFTVRGKDQTTRFP